MSMPMEVNNWSISYGEMVNQGTMLRLHGTLAFTVYRAYVPARIRFWIDDQLVSDVTGPSDAPPTQPGEYVQTLDDSDLIPLASPIPFSMRGHIIQMQFDYIIVDTGLEGGVSIGPKTFYMNTEIAVYAVSGLGAAGLIIYLVTRKKR